MIANLIGALPPTAADLLLGLIIIAGFLFFTSLIPLAPNSYWWYLCVGHDIHFEISFGLIALEAKRCSSSWRISAIVFVIG